MKIHNIFSKAITLILAFCMVISIAACSGSAEITSVEFDKASLMLNIGESEVLTYTVLPSSAAGESASWLSSDTSVATVSGGTVTGVAEGSAAIRVTVGGKSATCTVTVSDPSKATVAATGISLDKSTLSLNAGDNVTLTATVLPDNASNKTVTWTTSNSSVATVNNGTVTAVGGGSAVITASTYNNYSATCVVTVEGETAEDDLYVAKVSSLEGRDDFIMGMDASEILSLENAGVTYKNFDGETEDVFSILKDNGVTDIRIRIWNDPYDSEGNSYGGGNCDTANAVAIATRCAAVGLGVIIDFHYSDFWADPGKQTVPKAWQGLTTSETATALYNFTKDSLTQIKATGVTITMVQIGNETNGMMAGASDWSTICTYMNSGSQAVREVTGSVSEGGAKVAVHFTNSGYNVFAGYAQTLKNNSVDYDVFGVSWYPYYESHGTLSNLTSQLKTIYNTYGKDVMVLETAYAYTEEDFDGLGNTALETKTQPTTVQGQSNAVREVIEAIADLGDYGLGICYWGGTWIAASTSTSGSVNQAICKQYGCGWATSYAKGYDSDANDGGSMVDNQTFFRSDGTPLQSLKVFSLVYEGQTVDIKADYLEDQEVYYTVNEGPIELPSTVSVVLNNGSEQTVTAIWSVSESQLSQYIGTVDLYEIEGTTLYGGTCICYVWVMNVNLLSDGSFEELTAYGDSTTYFIQSDLGAWNLDYTKATSALQLFVSNNSGNARMGTNSFHFWDEGTVSFDLYQTLDISALASYGSGSYGCSFDFQGNDGENIDIYAYITVTYKDGTTETFKGNNIEMSGWQNFNRTSVTGVEIDVDNVASVTIGIHVYAEAINQGPWGNIDNAQFYFEG